MSINPFAGCGQLGGPSSQEQAEPVRSIREVWRPLCWVFVPQICLRFRGHLCICVSTCSQLSHLHTESEDRKTSASTPRPFQVGTDRRLISPPAFPGPHIWLLSQAPLGSFSPEVPAQLVAGSSNVLRDLIRRLLLRSLGGFLPSMAALPLPLCPPQPPSGPPCLCPDRRDSELLSSGSVVSDLLILLTEAEQSLTTNPIMSFC